MSSSVFSQTLQAITTTKLKELSKKCAIFEESKSALLSASELERDQKERLRILVHGVKQCFAVKTASRRRGDRRGGPGRIISGSTNDPDLEVMLKNLERFLEQARFDPSVSPKLLGDWENSLVRRLNVQSLKFQYATLYGELVNEWLRAEKVILLADNASDTSEGFEKVNRAEKEESRAGWESMVFEPFETDPMAISEYLHTLFGQKGTSKQPEKALDALRRSVEAFEATLSTPGQFNDGVLRWTINGLMASGLLSDEKRGVLKDFLASPVILAEVADVLNMRLSAISTWSWEGEVPIEQRRHVNGTYHVYIDEELLQAIFLQFIGVKWSVFFKEAFTNFSNYKGAWISPRVSLPNNAIDRKRREYFLGPQQKKPSVQAKRQGVYKSIFFMSQLPNSPFQEGSAVEGEEEVEYDTRPAKRSKQVAQQYPMAQAPPQMRMMPQGPPMAASMAVPQPGQMMQQQQKGYQQIVQAQQQMAQQRIFQQQPGGQLAHRPRDYNDTSHKSILVPHNNVQYDLEPEEKRPKSTMETKQYLLHLLSTEILINTRLYGDFTCSRSEFYSWSPSLSHSTISSVLSFFGLSDKWLGFFHKFLEAPLKFVEDGPSAETRPRKRGVPGAHALSTVCGEAILFCMDYAVNQETTGAQLYRMHDDFWIWSSKHEIVVQAWAAITKFADTMGVTLNKGKTGTVRILRDQYPSATINPSVLNKAPEAASSTQAFRKSYAPIHPSLPIGEIRWGFLVMDPASGRFVIDQEMVDKHVLELQRQLAEKDKSIFSWIQAWNTYAGTFFKSNFGKPANCFGREHVDMMLSTMTRIQKQIFSDSNVVEYLKSTLQERFGITDIPDGYLYFPTSLGGLELQNPFIGLIQVRDGVFEQPASVIDDFFEAEKEAYRRAQIAFENGTLYRSSNWDKNFVPDDSHQFFSFEEFTRYREEFQCGYDGDLLSVLEELLEQPGVDDVDFSSDDEVLMGKYIGEIGADGYGRWVAQLYGSEMKEKFGGLHVVDKGLLPMGMVTLFMSGRVKWQG